MYMVALFLVNSNSHEFQQIDLSQQILTNHVSIYSDQLT